MMMAKRKPKRVALYLRVSTTGQTVENQRCELAQVAERSGWRVAAAPAVLFALSPIPAITYL
jgi:hypothetical protein